MKSLLNIKGMKIGEGKLQLRGNIVIYNQVKSRGDTLKKKINIILYIILFLFAGLVIFLACSQSNQAIMSMPMPLQFVGEYSQDGGEWQTLSGETDLSACDGDLVLRGRFDPDLQEGTQLKLYLNHIGMNIFMNGECIFEPSLEQYSDMCGNAWVSWVLPALSREDTIEICLQNPHSYGNRDAYNEFFDSMFVSGDIELKHYYDKQSMPYRSICVFILVASITLIGTAVGYQLLHLPHSSLLLKLGIMSLLMSVYMYLDAKDISLWSDQMVFNTYVRQTAMMLAAWMFGTGVTELLREKRRLIAEVAVYALMTADFVFLALPFAGVMRIYDTGIYWAVIQGMVSLLLIVLCILEMKNSGKRERVMSISAVVFLAVLAAELCNARLSWWQSGICIKVVFVVLFMIYLLWAVKLVAVNYQASIRAKKQEEEMKENRISLAMSQIQPHFIYNSLNAIYHLCDKDIVMAQQAINDFSNYLQRSLSAIDRTTLISFEEELKHVKAYLKLEQLRFGKDLNVVYRIETTKFMLPALSVQPLVENAVKHGICKKEEDGGTVILTVRECPDCFEIIVSDDGVGFASEQENKGKGTHIGIRNVRQRLHIMCNAVLEITSEPGKGTTSTIRIPKEDEV